MEDEKIREILEEQVFPYSKMSKNERNLCLFYLSICREFRNAVILQCSFTKSDNLYIFNGIGYIKEKLNDENRCFNGSININNNNVKIKSNITRLCVNDNKEYSTLDSIKVNGNNYNIETTYCNSNKKYIEEINKKDNNIMKTLKK